jgi:hypothetical protein
MPRQGPTPEEELILLLCGTEERRRLTGPRILALSAVADHEALAALMERQLLLPIAGRRLIELAPPPLPSPFVARLEESEALARRRGLVLETLAEQVRADLEGAGIDALPLKGTTLSRALYGYPGARPAKDIDILIDSSRLTEAATVLRRRGYRPLDEAAGGGRRLHLGLVHERPELPPIELHWRVHWYEEAFSARMLRRSRRRGGGLRAQPADELASLLLFFARDGLAGLRLAADAATWWSLEGSPDRGEAPLLDAICAEAPELRGALSAAAATLEQLVGVPSRSLLSEPSASWRTRTANRLANWTVTGDLDQVGANLTLVDFLLSPPGGGRSFARRSLFPPTAQIASMYRLPATARWRQAFWRLVHGPKLLLRYSIAIWRVRGRRRWVDLPAAVRGV